jgi:hypothetical protein
VARLEVAEGKADKWGRGGGSSTEEGEGSRGVWTAGQRVGLGRDAWAVLMGGRAKRENRCWAELCSSRLVSGFWPKLA